ncbi:MAG: hypothetical protein KAY24_06625 [Candidatus Eisenbacteria sp.]|nr:hypothetical protein [Candidatus Eisenbacteria bacterium]
MMHPECAPCPESPVSRSHGGNRARRVPPCPRKGSALPAILWLAISGTATLLAILSLTVSCTPAQAANRFAVAEPVWKVNDCEPIPEPATFNWNRYHSFIDGYWLRPLDDVFSMSPGSPAEDINSFEEVPASSWFTPRIGRFSLSTREVEQGNTDFPSIDRSKPLQVTAARIDGCEPFLQVLEGSGASCILEFDDPRFPEMRTAAAVIANRLLYAAGYNVFECFIDEISPSDLQLAEGARKVGEFGGQSDLKGADLKKLLAKLGGNAQLRVAVSRLPAGIPKGQICDKGTRLDDANDRIAHQNRRSLRGLRILASWLNHTRMRPDRTLDIYLQPGGYLRHYLIGLGMALGAWVQSPHPFETEGQEPYWDMGTWTKNLLMFGFGKTYEPAQEASPFRGVGIFDSHGFDPLAWRPAYGFEPFRRMSWADAFWGARLVAPFSEEQIHAAVRAGALSDPDAAAFLAGTLIERRDRIALAWFAKLNAADRFQILCPTGGRCTLVFEDLGVACGVRQSGDIQYVMVFTLPETGETLGYQSRSGHNLEFDLAPFLPSPWLHRKDPCRYGCAAIRCYDYRGRPLDGETRVHIFFDADKGPRLIGIERI